MKTGFETLLEGYYKKVATYMLSQYKEPDLCNEQELQEFRHFTEIYSLMQFTAEAVGDFEFARQLDGAFKAVVGFPCSVEAEDSKSLVIRK